MNVQQLRKALLMASDGAEVRIAFREVLLAGDHTTDAPAGGTCYDIADNSFTIYEADMEDSCSPPTETGSSSPESPNPAPPPTF